MNIEQFRTHMTQYFKVKRLKETPKEVQERFDERRRRFNTSEFIANRSDLNVVEVDIEHFMKKSGLNNPFMKENDEYMKAYLFEYVMPYYNEYRNSAYDYAHSEVIYDLYVYDQKEQKIISYLEARIGIGSFESYFQNAFVGMISVENAYKKNGLSTFMLRVSSSFLWFKQRKKLYSGTIISDEFLPVLHHLKKKTDWVIREDHWNELSQKEQERYWIKPISFGVQVKDGKETWDF